MSARRVKVRGLDGYTEEFTATVIPGLERVPAGAVADDRGDLAIISTEAGELLAVPADSLEYIE